MEVAQKKKIIAKRITSSAKMFEAIHNTYYSAKFEMKTTQASL